MPRERLLTLVRHGHAESHCPSDHERNLIDRGRRRVTKTAHWLAEAFEPANLIMTSTAWRATQTAEIIHEIAAPKAAVAALRQLYLADVFDITAVLQTAPPETHHLLVVGHNPGMELLTTLLNNNTDLALPVKPGTAVVFKTPCKSWADFSPFEVTYCDMYVPRRSGH